VPELPEVETIRVGLQRLLPGRIIKSVSHDTEKSFPNAQPDIDTFLLGAEIVGVRRRAKVLLIDLSTDYSLVIHLKMTGQLVFDGQNEHFGAGHPSASLVGELPDKSTRVIIAFEPEERKITDGLETSARKRRSAEEDVQKVRRLSTRAADAAIGQERWRDFGLRPKAGQRVPQLFFNDQRKFGWMRLIPTVEIPSIDFMKKVGPEPLEDDFTWQVMRERLQRRKNTNIKAAILDQSVIAGVGNIYADESLWGAKLHPSRLVKTLQEKDYKALHKALVDVLRLSIQKGGSSDKNYVDADGKRGSYLSFANVFRREGKACPRCGTTIEKTRVAGRGTHICPVCQQLI
jgi:formamidopyrimidine-DNA glycosylase